MSQASRLPSKPLPLRSSTPRGVSPRADQAIQVVLGMLRERLGMDVVFVRHFNEGARRFRVVEALSHGPAAAMATAQAPTQQEGVLLEAPVVLHDGRVHGCLCGYSTETAPASVERQLRLLQHGARFASRLLDNEEVLRELGRQSLSH
ncbi:MAG: hypothetical protein ACXWC6_01860 [Ramlibacter sp.]